MYILSKFKCQLNFNWHLNLIEGCATQLLFVLCLMFYKVVGTFLYTGTIILLLEIPYFLTLVLCGVYKIC